MHLLLLLLFLSSIVCADRRAASDHYKEGQHNVDFDHKSFLGEDEEQHEHLSSEEGLEKLGQIFHQIDSDNDGIISEEELVKWLKFVQDKYVREDLVRQWENMGIDEDDKYITFENYKAKVYSDPGLEDQQVSEGEQTETSRFIGRDYRRWMAADVDGDGKLSYEEFGTFNHPENVPHLSRIVVLETIEDLDKDGDGKVSEAEYLSDMYDENDDGSEPDWIQSEREQFRLYRDINKDGFLDESEVKEWISPSEYDSSEAESRHLIDEADVDKDGSISKKEMLDKYDLFVGSQATDFGEYLSDHDEL